MTARHREDYGGATGILQTAGSITVICFNALGFYGYIRFGDAIQSNITYNLPSDQWLVVTRCLKNSVITSKDFN